MEKQEKSWIDEEREREYQTQMLLNGEPYQEPTENEDDRYRVTGEEEANYESNRLKRLALVALIGLMLAVPATHITMHYVNDYRAAQEQKQIQEHIIGAVKVGDVTLEIATPEMNMTDDGFKYMAPKGFNYDGYNCYRLSCEGEAPAGYVKDENNTLYPVDSEIKYQAPEHYILIGDKAVEVIDAEAREVNGEIKYFVPNGYTLVGKLGFKMIKAIPLEDEYGNRINIEETVEPITTVTYSVPSGYTLSGTKGTKTETVSPTATTVDGKTIYSVPAGYALQYIDGKPYGVRTVTINATATYKYTAPEGYYYFDGKCYKLEEPTVEETKGR